MKFTMQTKSKLLSVSNLSVQFAEKKVLHHISFDVFENEIVGIVGESASGKSVTSLAIMGLLPKKNVSLTGAIFFQGKNILTMTQRELQHLRGSTFSMVFQEPMSSLNPSMTCGKQVAEILVEHTSLSKKHIKKEVLNLFNRVKLPDVQRIFDSYPHQLSGGQKQRIMIAMAIACRPKLLIADEPTTALDATVQKEIIELLKSIQQETHMSILFISHDISLVSQISDRVVVMFKGDIVEEGSAQKVFYSPKALYTQALLASKPSTDIRLKRLPTIQDFLNNSIQNQVETPENRTERHQKIYASPPLLRIENLTKTYVSKAGIFQKEKSVVAVNSVTLFIYEGETLGLVGESGCGKTTLGRTLIQLEKATSGQIFYKGNDVTKLNTKQLHSFRKDIQLIFQDPYSSLNPSKKIGDAIQEPMKVHKLYKNNSFRKQKVVELLEKVGLSASDYDKYPHQFSGGQRQRIGIARAIALHPKLIICDESVSALDISVQAQVLNLLNDLKDDFGFTYLFISHDLSVVKYMSDRIAVMNKGEIEEIAEADTLYLSPQKSYTQRLIKASDY
ncbi:ABC transporter ATP-binding protein [Capnocytophaga catalasegens]|nr:ABC transporter ATP-binding protein [Capnocytophaga catalasegens]